MGNTNSCSKINYEDMQDCVRSGNSNNIPCLIINTISPERQSCLIVNTVSIESEEKRLILQLAINHINVYQKRIRVSI